MMKPALMAVSQMSSSSMCTLKLPVGVEHAAVASTRHQARGGWGWGTGSGDD